MSLAIIENYSMQIVAYLQAFNIKLFNKCYKFYIVLVQWKCVKIIMIHKTGKSEISIFVEANKPPTNFNRSKIFMILTDKQFLVREGRSIHLCRSILRSLVLFTVYSLFLQHTTMYRSNFTGSAKGNFLRNCIKLLFFHASLSHH